MKILLVHNAYQHWGGEDTVAEAETRLLMERGHSVVKYQRSNDDLGGKNGLASLGAGVATVWSVSSYRAIKTTLAEAEPDVAHFHNTFPLISPAAYYACAEAGVPVVQTLHNYRLLCPGAALYRDGQPCEECLPIFLKWRGVLHACYRDSRFTTAGVAAMLAVHSSLGTWREKVTQYIALSEFSRRKFIAGDLPAAKITVKPNFVSPDPQIREGDGDCALSVGRLTGEKGTDVLLKAWSKIGRAIPLRIVGDGPLRPDLEQKKAALGLENITFEGTLPNALILRAMKQARFLVFSSQCYENFPLVIAEAYACGVPVVAPRLGAAGEIVRDGATGLHFAPGDAEDLAAKVEWAWSHLEEMREMGGAARAEYEGKYTAGQNYKMLMAIYEQALCRSKEATEHSATVRTAQK
jgi:glycosyltransferase involved in cell wall biosynthesis